MSRKYTTFANVAIRPNFESIHSNTRMVVREEEQLHDMKEMCHSVEQLCREVVAPPYEVGAGSCERRRIWKTWTQARGDECGAGRAGREYRKSNK